jgi:hypothetical protein
MGVALRQLVEALHQRSSRPSSAERAKRQTLAGAQQDGAAGAKFGDRAIDRHQVRLLRPSEERTRLRHEGLSVRLRRLVGKEV